MKNLSTPNRAVFASLIITLAGSASADIVNGRTQIGGWDFSNNQASDLLGNNAGTINGRVEIAPFDGRNAAGFSRGRSQDYISFEHREAYELTDGAIAINFQQTGRWNPTETLFSKDARGYMDGGHLTISLRKGHGSQEGFVQVRLQSQSESFYVNSGMLDLNQWYNMEFAFGADGMRLAIDGIIVDTNEYTGGIANNNEGFSLGSARWRSDSGEWNHMSDGLSGQISSVGIYGSAVPAPGTAALVAIGGLVCFRRKR